MKITAIEPLVGHPIGAIESKLKNQKISEDPGLNANAHSHEGKWGRESSFWVAGIMRLVEIVFGACGLVLWFLTYPFVLLAQRNSRSTLRAIPVHDIRQFFLVLVHGGDRFGMRAPPRGTQIPIKNSGDTEFGMLQPKNPEPDANKIRNFLTVDVECWFHAYNIGEKIPRSTWHLQETQILKDMDRLLLLLRTRNTKATFFVLGWVADHFPEVVRMIDAEGHEIATHGYHHELVTRMTPQEFESDLLQSLEAINRHTSQEVLGHRASNFTVVKDTLWALEILAKNGIRYDSSIFPISRKRYGIAGYSHRNPHVLRMPDGRPLIELPMSTFRLFGSKPIPIAGGGYFRLYPYHLTAAFIENQNRRNLPAMVYLHPWELDYGQARHFLGASKTFQHYVNLESTEWKLDRLLERFSFGSVKEGLSGARNLIRDNVVSLSELYESPEVAQSNSDYLRKMSGKDSSVKTVLEEAELHSLVG